MQNGIIITGSNILFFERPSVKADPKIAAQISVGVPIISVIRIIIELQKEISNKIDTTGIEKIIGKHVKVQQHIILRNKTSSIDTSEVR